MKDDKKNSISLVKLGYSDIASLTVRICSDMEDNFNKAEVLSFGIDGEYSAYVVDEYFEIPSEYQLEIEAKTWIMIYDDSKLRYSARAEKIEIYMGRDEYCIIKLIGKN